VVVSLLVEGWWFVQVQDTDEQGWAPASCLLPENREQLADIAITGNNYHSLLTDGQTDRRTPYRFIDPAPRTV